MLQMALAPFALISCQAIIQLSPYLNPPVRSHRVLLNRRNLKLIHELLPPTYTVNELIRPQVAVWFLLLYNVTWRAANVRHCWCVSLRCEQGLEDQGGALTEMLKAWAQQLLGKLTNGDTVRCQLLMKGVSLLQGLLIEFKLAAKEEETNWLTVLVTDWHNLVIAVWLDLHAGELQLSIVAYQLYYARASYKVKL